ncbi:MAG: glycosyltransferase [Dehalococcoidia bacterium]|jgi:GT2 family glycosyltransferase
MITIITPWLNHPELIPGYESVVQGAQVIIIDNGSDEASAKAIREMVERLKGIYIRNAANKGYAAANNQGLEAATGEVTIFLNNDITASPGWLIGIPELPAGALYGTSFIIRYVDGVCIPYLEGWCLIGHTSDFRKIGGWAQDWDGLYWEDNELCWRATRAGLSLRPIGIPIQHLNNYTSKDTPGAYDKSDANRERFYEIVRRDRAISNRV